MRYRCGHCQATVSLPLRRHGTDCPACSRPILVNPEKPLLNFWFLFALVLGALPLVTTLMNGHWEVPELVSGAVMLLIPAAIYFAMLYFSGAQRLYAGQGAGRVEPSLGLSATPLATARPEPAIAAAPRPAAQPPARPSKAAAVFGLLLMLAFIAAYLAWVYVYLAVLRPRMNEWLAQYISSYPAMLHLIPLIGLPVLIVWIAGGIVKLGGKALRPAKPRA